MRKIAVVTASFLLFLTHQVIADPHYNEAIKHATAASQAGDSAGVIEHALPALEHTMSGALTAKGITKTHTDGATKALETALDLAKNKKTEEAKASVSAALEHLKAANKKK